MPPPPPFKIFVFSRTAGYRHESILAGIKALRNFAAISKCIICDASEDPSKINQSNLSQYRVLIFLNTSGNFLGEAQLNSLKGYIRAGGGFVGIHCAAAGMPNDIWYGNLVGAAFMNHPKPQNGVIKIENTEHILTKGFPTEWEWHDEWYNFRANPRGKVEILMSINESCYEGGSMGNDHPLAWCQEFEGARSFYTSLGHFNEAWEDEIFMEHITRGILWAAGQL